MPAPKAKHSTRTQRAAEPARADARSWLTRVNQFNREMSDLQQALSDDSEGTSSWIEAGRDRVSLASVSEGTSSSIEAGRDQWGQRICQFVGRWVSQRSASEAKVFPIGFERASLLGELSEPAIACTSLVLTCWAFRTVSPKQLLGH